MNQAQADFLRQMGVKHHSELLDPMRRLDFANLHDEPDVAPEQAEPALTEGQRLYLASGAGGGSVAGLDAIQREIFNSMGTPTDTTAGASHASAASRDLDHAKLNAAYPNSPTQRLTIAYAWDTVLQDRKEAAAGIAPELRESRNDIARARELVGPYLT